MREGGRLREIEHLRGLRRGRRRAGEEREGGCCHGHELNCVSHGPHPFRGGGHAVPIMVPRFSPGTTPTAGVSYGPMAVLGLDVGTGGSRGGDRRRRRVRHRDGDRAARGVRLAPHRLGRAASRRLVARVAGGHPSGPGGGGDGARRHPGRRAVGADARRGAARRGGRGGAARPHLVRPADRRPVPAPHRRGRRGAPDRAGRQPRPHRVHPAQAAVGARRGARALGPGADGPAAQGLRAVAAHGESAPPTRPMPRGPCSSTWPAGAGRRRCSRTWGSTRPPSPRSTRGPRSPAVSAARGPRPPASPPGPRSWPAGETRRRGAVGMGIVRPGAVSATIGTSGVVFAATDRPARDPPRTGAHLLSRGAGPLARHGG